MSNGLQRGAADACLHQVLGDLYGNLRMDEAGRVIDYLIQLDQHEGTRDLYRAAEILRERVMARATLPAFLADERQDSVRGYRAKLLDDFRQRKGWREESARGYLAQGDQHGHTFYEGVAHGFGEAIGIIEQYH
jgi:hypothetical protein